MKTLAKKCIGYLGYEITKVPRSSHGAKGSAPTAVDHNSRSMRESFYADSHQVASYLNAERRRFYRDVTELLARKVPALATTSLRIADYGCGPGMLLKHIGDLSPTSVLHGYDFANSGLRVAREILPAATFAERDLYDSFPDRYDVILCTEVLEHLEHPHLALSNLLDQVAEGGLLLVTVPDGRMDQYAGHIHFWSPESWMIFIEDRCPGLEIETGRISATRSSAFLYAAIARTTLSTSR